MWIGFGSGWWTRPEIKPDCLIGYSGRAQNKPIESTITSRQLNPTSLSYAQLWHAILLRWLCLRMKTKTVEHNGEGGGGDGDDGEDDEALGGGGRGW